MPRPTPADVTTAFRTSLEEPEVDAVIDDAQIFLRQAYESGELDDETETAMWKYLVRHLIRFEPDRQQERKAVGSAQVEYSGTFGEKLDATSPGQMVQMLDEEDRFTEIQDDTQDVFFRSL